METKLVTLFGGGGFVGRALAQELFARGWRVRIAQRNPRRAYAIKSLGGLGQTQFAAVDISRPASVANVIAGSSAVVNLVGLLKGNLQSVHVDGAANIAAAAAAAGVGAMVQVSAIGADAQSPSLYGRTKSAGEAAVRAAFPGATIVRPSIIFGRDDQFTNRFAGLIRTLPVVPVIAAKTRLQPIFVGDVAKALAEAITDPLNHAGKTYEIGGGDILTMLEFNTWLANAIGRTKDFVAVPDGVAQLLASATGWAPGAPITSDQLAMLRKDNVADTALPGLAALGVQATPLAAIAPSWLSSYRKHGRFGDRLRA
ncbi:MAG TPA: complex I NDUFA9 subunit family protein [Sphingobium sp.]